MTKKYQLDHIIEMSTALLKVKTTQLDSLVSKRGADGTVLQKDMDNLNKEIKDANKKRFSLFK